MVMQPKSFVEPDQFYCRGYKKKMSIHECMSNFVDANALKQKDRPCYQCTQGKEMRAEFSKT